MVPILGHCVNMNVELINLLRFWEKKLRPIWTPQPW